MSWKKLVVPYATDPVHVQEQLFKIALLESASGSFDRTVALLASDDEGEFVQTIWLLSPAAAKYVDALPGRWEDLEDPTSHYWTVLYSAGVTMRELGLQARFSHIL